MKSKEKKSAMLKKQKSESKEGFLSRKKVSQIFLKEDFQVEKLLKDRMQNNLLEVDKEESRSTEIDFFCDKFSNIPFQCENCAKVIENNDGQGDDFETREKPELDQHYDYKSDLPLSIHSNESSPNTHMASAYIGYENDCENVIGKFECSTIAYDSLNLLSDPGACKISDAYAMDISANIKNLGYHSREARISSQLNFDNTMPKNNSSDLKSFDSNTFEKLIDNNTYFLTCDLNPTPIHDYPVRFQFASIEKVVNENRFLKIFISRLSFDQHQLFTKEHEAAKLVEKLFAEYERRTKSNIVGVVRMKLQNLRNIRDQKYPLNEEKNAKYSFNSEKNSINQQINRVRTKLHVEKVYDREVVKCLLENWRNLKSLRNHQKFAYTHLTLKIVKLQINVNENQIERQKQYDAELNELMAEEFDKYYAERDKYKEIMRSNNNDTLEHDDKRSVKQPRKPNIDKIISELDDVYNSMPIDTPDLNIFLFCDGNESPPKQFLRKLDRLTYRVDLAVDDEILASTKHFQLNTEFSLEINSAFTLKLQSRMQIVIKIIVCIFYLF